MIEAKEYIAAIRPLMDARQTRIRQVLPVTTISHDKFGGPSKTGLGNDGTILFFLARNQKVMDQAMESMAKGLDGTQDMIKGIERQMGKLKPGPLEEVMKSASGGIFGTLTYGGCPILDPVFLPDGLDLTIVNIPYCGGRLIPNGFKLVAYPNPDGDDDGWCGTVVPRRPKLTPSETEAFGKIPPDLSTIFVGNGYDCEYTSAMAIAFGVAGAVAGAAAGPGGAVGGAVAGAAAGAAIDAALVHAMGGRMARLDVSLSDSQIAKMGPGLAAKTLVNMRREALSKLSSQVWG